MAVRARNTSLSEGPPEKNELGSNFDVPSQAEVFFGTSPSTAVAEFISSDGRPPSWSLGNYFSDATFGHKRMPKGDVFCEVSFYFVFCVAKEREVEALVFWNSA